jgi:hypothetical protein
MADKLENTLSNVNKFHREFKVAFSLGIGKTFG